jgi:hypothetical protein
VRKDRSTAGEYNDMPPDIAEGHGNAMVKVFWKAIVPTVPYNTKDTE